MIDLIVHTSQAQIVPLFSLFTKLERKVGVWQVPAWLRLLYRHSK